jgi:L-lactate dehydrogenase
VGLTIAEVIHAIALDQPTILPVSSQLTGQYGIRGACLSVPTTVARAGVVRRHEVELWTKEQSAMQASAAALDATWEQVQA